MSAWRAKGSLLYAIAGGVWRDHPGRLALAVLGIAFGVALGVAVHLINASAANEFNLAVRALAGEAHLVVRAPRAGFPDALYPRIARLAQVEAASPALELDAQLAARRETIKVLGLDPFRAAQVQPQLVAGSRGDLLELLKPDTVLLSRSAADALGLAAGDTLRLHAGAEVIALRILALLPAGATRQPLAIMDIAEAQSRFGRIGDLHRIDIRLRAGTDVAAFRRTLVSLVPPGTVVDTPRAEAERSASMARAYRTNLDMLALVALFTGAFLVFSTQFLALVRRRAQLALLRVLGVTEGELLRLLVLEGFAVGVAGAAMGVGLGWVLARLGIDRLGGDLGAGYFRAISPELHFDAPALAAFFVLGIFFAVLGAALPAFEAARRPPAQALKAGDEEQALRGLRHTWPSFALFATGLALTQAPAVGDFALGGYGAIALILLASILIMPQFAAAVLSRLPSVRNPPAALAAAQLQATPRQVGVSLAAILASFSLMVSMLIMVGSFRTSLETWLDQMLPADLYVRAGRAGETGYLTPEQQDRIAAVTGVTQTVFVRSQNVFMRADRPPVSLLARPLPDGATAPPLPFEGARLSPAAGAPPPAWLSEVAADLLDTQVGATIEVPIAGASHPFTVAGIWRDYARQNGAIVIDRVRYVAMTQDTRVNEAALHLATDASPDAVAQAVRAAFGRADGIEIASTRELKALSLAIFDRTFAVTYALEAAAIVIGLFGVSASFSAQALARRREFGVLRHLGMTRRQVAAMLAWEGLSVGSLGVVAGVAVGWVISLILIHVINRQSFHWSMDLHFPALEVAALALGLIVAATLTAVFSGRRAMTDDVTRAVKDDW